MLGPPEATPAPDRPMIPRPTLPPQMPAPALTLEQAVPAAAPTAPLPALAQRPATPGNGNGALRPRQGLTGLSARSPAAPPGSDGPAWWALPQADNPHGDAAWWATMAAELRAGERAVRPDSGAGPAATAIESSSDDESDDDGSSWIVCDTGSHPSQHGSDPSPTGAQMPAPRAGALADCEDFGPVLGMSGNNFQALGQMVWDLHDASLHFRAACQSGLHEDALAKAQGLAIKHKVLDGLCTMKQQQREWLRFNPQVHDRVAAAWREALTRCRTEASAAMFPIRGFDAPLQEVERQMHVLREGIEQGVLQVPLPGDPDPAQAHADRIRTWRMHGEAIEAHHGRQDWAALVDVLAGRGTDTFARVQARQVPRHLLAAMHSPLPGQRRQATAAALAPRMEPLAWALARQVHSEIACDGQTQDEGRARQAAALCTRMEAVAAELAGALQNRYAAAAGAMPGRDIAVPELLQQEMGAFARELARRAHCQLVAAQNRADGHEAAQEATLQAALRPPVESPRRAAERTAARQRLLQSCRALGEVAGQLRAALQAPPEPPTRTATPPQPQELSQALQALKLKDDPADVSAATANVQPPADEPAMAQSRSYATVMATLPAPSRPQAAEPVPAGPHGKVAAEAASLHARTQERPVATTARKAGERQGPWATSGPASPQHPARTVRRPQARPASMIDRGPPPPAPAAPRRAGPDIAQAAGPSTAIAAPTRPAARPQHPGGGGSPVPQSSSAAAQADAVPVAEPALNLALNRQKEQAAALQAALALPLAQAQRCTTEARACRDAASRTGPAWMQHAREFTAWQQAVLAHDACAEQIPVQAVALFGADAAALDVVRDMQKATAEAAHRALAQAAQAARKAWESFALACDASLVRGGRPDEELAEQARDLHAQWRDSPLRERLPDMAACMEQFSAFEIACNLMRQGPQALPKDPVQALYQASQWRVAIDLSRAASRGATGAEARRQSAFRALCKQHRDALLIHAVQTESEMLTSFHEKLIDAAEPALNRCRALLKHYDTTLGADPLPEGVAAQAPQPAAPAIAGADEAAEDEHLAESVRRLSGITVDLRERCLRLPSDSPRKAKRHQQQSQTILRQIELRARTAELVLSGFHQLARRLDAATPAQRPRVARTGVDDLTQLVLSQRDAIKAHQGTIEDPASREMFIPLASSAALLRADVRLAERALALVKLQEHLLTFRSEADQARQQIRQGRSSLRELPFLGWGHHTALIERGEQLREALRTAIDVDAALIGEQPWMADERTQVEVAMDRFRLKVEHDAAMIRAGLLLAHAELLGGPQDRPTTGTSSMAELRQYITERTQDLTRISREIKARAPSSDQLPADAAQLQVNQALRRRLLTLQVALRQDAAPPQAAP